MAAPRTDFIVGIIANLSPARTPEVRQSMPEDRFYRDLSAAARRYNAQVAVLILPEAKASFGSPAGPMDAGTFSGYVLENDQWRLQHSIRPNVLYDRFFPHSSSQLHRYRSWLAGAGKRANPPLLSSGRLPGKWNVYQLLNASSTLSEFVPATARLNGAAPLARMLRETASRGVFLKPASGMQGRGAVHIAPVEGSGEYALIGRTRSNKLFQCTASSMADAIQWMLRFAGSSAYIIQPYLELENRHGQPFDIRSLAQREATGNWAVAGMAMRIGRAGYLTSNLHGGGSGMDAQQGLAAQFGSSQARQMLERIRELTLDTARTLEQHCGRFIELGIDFGIEPSGKLWLLEANSKPGRTLFSSLHNGQHYWKSLDWLLINARLLLKFRYAALSPFSQVRMMSHFNTRLPVDNVQEVLT